MAVYVESFELANGWCGIGDTPLTEPHLAHLTEYFIRYRNLVSVPWLQSQLHCPNIWVWLQILYHKKFEMAQWMVNIFNDVHITLSPTCIIIGYERYHILWTQDSGLKLFIQQNSQQYAKKLALYMEQIVISWYNKDVLNTPNISILLKNKTC